ncbi:hypothetical protein HAL09_01350 [Helicobacter ailurogastricus]|uniref:Uncharacterized protein n=1 Tax=Helicobacter ailurogastricus TaxID=1578720 RepID=A0A0K2X6Y6_9HELI|nr:hypothetical protein HAL011_11320 [Helicobacter ailurogastricus]CRF43589.1 hypothetical protein HAL09_01350 [Helicobacter ailurogastricus]
MGFLSSMIGIVGSMAGSQASKGMTEALIKQMKDGKSAKES